MTSVPKGQSSTQIIISQFLWNGFYLSFFFIESDVFSQQWHVSIEFPHAINQIHFKKIVWFMASIHKTIAPFEALELKILILQANRDLEREEIL